MTIIKVISTKTTLIIWQYILKNQISLLIQTFNELFYRGYNALDIIKQLIIFYNFFIKNRLINYSRIPTSLYTKGLRKFKYFLLKLEQQIKFSCYPQMLLEVNIIILSDYLNQGLYWLKAYHDEKNTLNYIWKNIIYNINIISSSTSLLFQNSQLVNLSQQKIIIGINSTILLKIIRNKISLIKRELTKAVNDTVEIQIKIDRNIGSTDSPLSTLYLEYFNAFSNLHTDYRELQYMTRLLYTYYYR